MRLWRLFPVFLLISGALLSRPVWSADIPHRLALGTTVIGGQVHWGFADRWAVEARVLTGKEESQAGTVTGAAYGLRGYWYFRKPSRVRFFLGGEVAATRSYSQRYDYETNGMAYGAFGGSELYLLKRLSVGVDMGPYLLTTRVRDSETRNGEIVSVINTFMNFYFL